jgi:hypothetical protein
MAKKIFLNRIRELPIASGEQDEVPVIRAEQNEPSTSRGSAEFEPVQHGGLVSVTAPPSTWIDTVTPSTSIGSSGFDSLEQEDPSTPQSEWVEPESPVIESREPLFQILDERSKKIKKYNTVGRTLHIKFSEPGKMRNL